MPKWIGGIFGNTIASTAIGDAIKGVFSSADQYYLKQEGGWAFFSVSPSTSSVNEGSSVTFTTTTSGVSDGTTLYWTLNTVSGTINASDFSGGATSGSFTITSNSGSVVLTLANDITTEGSESFQFQVRIGSTGGTIVATSSTVTIGDTSLSYVSATGGTTVDSGGFRIHVFTSPGSFVVSNAGPGTVEYLVVAGGGSGGGHYGGGGGAGGFRTATSFPVTATTYPITIGGGGAQTTPGSPVYPAGNDGSPSIFSTITSTGGGGGGGRGSGVVARPGGSGGGGGGGSNPTEISPGVGNTPPTSPPQGNSGGTSSENGSLSRGGGGGGAGAVGSNGPSPSIGGVGSPITWVPASYGTPGPAPGRYFAGGGGGGSQDAGGAAGGAGGGASGGGGNVSGGAGTTNTGGGGGGASQSENGSRGGAGGSGIVVIRYPIS